ncbi:disintegrin and metalloproteinase domain-containing protein 17-like [Physella acuta]|uniref:disintegrin and metalloproteinase domain-containing protein 17-like n=1 Tax=Physella acuta TaxID=109671 RepID=UPI0027DE2D48|nr:disintegrin and metalloproteinase domain-containing protein 17-like [Physella acuta]
MRDKAVSGNLPNNKRFSPCSLSAIGQKIAAAHCLVAKSPVTMFCGNGIVDPGEECDAGALGLAHADECCSEMCTLKSGAQCSDMNSECCHKCKKAGPDVVCFDSGKTDCKKISYCDP